MHMLYDMCKTLDSDMHFGVGRSGDWSKRMHSIDGTAGIHFTRTLL